MNKLAVITGGCSGIGLATALKFLNSRWRVVVLDKDYSGHLAKMLEEKGGSLIRCDITKEDEIKKAAEAIASLHGGIDVLINNAGIIKTERFEAQFKEEWHEIFDVNVFGLMLCSQIFGRKMIEQKSGMIINIASDIENALRLENGSAYIASKSAVIGFTRALAEEWGQFNVRVNAVCPPLVKSGMTGELFEKGNLAGEIKIVTLEQVAEAVFETANKDINGEIIFV